jgi:hypothetical protein
MSFHEDHEWYQDGMRVCLALAVNSNGETVELSLDGIYQLAASLGQEVSVVLD